MLEQKNEKFVPAGEGASHKRLAKLRQEISAIEKKLAQEKIGAEKEILQATQTEGNIGKEKAGGFSVPTAPQTVQQDGQAIGAQNQVQALCDLAFQKGVDAAIEAARLLDNPYVLDELHDAMVGKLYERLKNERKVEAE